MFGSCDYCFTVFDMYMWDWCVLKNEVDLTSTTLCSQCCAEIFFNQKCYASIV